MLKWFVLAALTSTLLPAAAHRHADAAPPASAPATRPSNKLTVAVLDFSTETPGTPDLGTQISEVLTATLGGENAYTLVDRSSLTRVLQEHELSLTGLVDANQATKIGRLVGARLLVSGKVFVIDKQLFITAKLIGTETSLVEGILVKGEVPAGIDPLIVQLSQKLASRLVSAGPTLVAQDDLIVDPLPGLKTALASRQLPKVAIRITERHLTDVPAAHVDPAAETELKMMLTDCGFTVVEGTNDELARAGVQLLVTGEAFSEPAAHIGTLISCTDRLELTLTRLPDKKIMLADRDNNRAVDLSEHLAGKLAIQKSARLLGVKLLRHLANTLPAAKP